MEQIDYKTLLTSFSPQEIAEVKQALAEKGYPVVSAEDILEVLQKVQAQANMNKIHQQQQQQQQQNVEKERLHNEESYNNSDDVNGNVLKKEKDKVQSEVTYKYKEHSLADKEILALGRQYYAGQCEDKKNGDKYEKHVYNNNTKNINVQNQRAGANTPYYFDEHDLQKHNYHRRSSLPSWNSSTHISRRPVRGPHFPLLNERVRLIPNDFMHSKSQSQMSDLHLYNSLSPRARLERQLRNYYTHQQNSNHRRQSAADMNAARAAKYTNNTQHHTNYKTVDDNVNTTINTSHNAHPLHSAHSKVNRQDSNYRKTSKGNKLSADMPHYMTPADRRAANLIFNITGDSRYRFRPATDMYHSIPCTSNNSENIIFYSNNNNYKNNAEKVYSHMYNANASDRHKGRPLSSFSVSYLNTDGSTLYERADPVQRGAQMRELWRRDRFLHQRQEPSLPRHVL